MHLLRAPLIAAAVLLAGAAMLAPAPAAAGPDDLIDISIFYEDLNEGGDWFEHPRYGYVWSPDVDPYWRPYTRGRWIYTDDYGWFWDSDEPFGWAVYHYGRWGFDEEDGWFWVPGRQWGPAWVAWRYGDDYAGWAPLPPGAVWSPELGIVYDGDFHVSVRFDPFWIFVRPRYITYYNPYRFARPRSRYRHIFRYTRPAAGYVYVNGRIFFHGIGPRQYRRIARRSLPRTRVNFYYDKLPGKRRGWSKSKTVRIFRPGKKRRYRAKRLKAPHVVYKTSPRRAAWKRRAKRSGSYKAGSAKGQSWRAERDRRKVRARRNGVTIPGGEPKPKTEFRRQEGSTEEVVKKTNTERELTPAAKAKATSLKRREAGEEVRPKRRAKANNKVRPKRKAKANDEARAKRRAKPPVKSAGAKRGNRAAKAKEKGKDKGKGKEKQTAKN